MAKILGIDEAGRGAVIGPLVICGALIKSKDIKNLRKLKVRDSKLLSPSQRENLIDPVKKELINFKLIMISPNEIDSKRRAGTNLNDIEAEKMAQIINNLKPDKVYIDAIDPTIKTFLNRLKKFLRFDPKKIIAEHEADIKYPIVSAASIIAKVSRDKEIKEIGKIYEIHGSIGSGYPSDEVTIKFLNKWLKENKKLPRVVRETWSTAELLQKKGKQKSLKEWLQK